jgi:hypothetical protein
MPAWQACRRLVGDELFLLSANPESFDRRYFGPVSVDAVIGRAQPLCWSPPDEQTFSVSIRLPNAYARSTRSQTA